MTLGERIKRIRTFRGLTQRELGLKLGYEERNADVRVAQYESGYRVPKKDTLMEIARILNVNYINFVTEAGERCSYALFCLITSPVSRLISTLDFTFDFLFSSAFAQIGKLSTNDNTNIKLITLFIKSPTNIYYNYLVLITIF